MISIRANDAAVAALGFPFDAEDPLTGADPGELGRRLRSGGLVRDEKNALYVPDLSYRRPHVPEFPTLTDRECWMNSWHLDPYLDGFERDEDGVPRLEPEHQLRMLKHGIALSRIVRELARELPDQPPICCVTLTNRTNGVFKFHQVRAEGFYLSGTRFDIGDTSHPGVELSMVIQITQHSG